MNYRIFRSQLIMTINDLVKIEAHNKRGKKAYKSNKDIKLELAKNNIELVPLTEKYVKGFKLKIKNYIKKLIQRDTPFLKNNILKIMFIYQNYEICIM